MRYKHFSNKNASLREAFIIESLKMTSFLFYKNSRSAIFVEKNRIKNQVLLEILCTTQPENIPTIAPAKMSEGQ